MQGWFPAQRIRTGYHERTGNNGKDAGCPGTECALWSIHAIRDISLTVNEGEIVSLIGANGAGKTTTLHTITGIKKATSGRIFLDGKDLMATEPHKIITMGMAHVPEGRHIFSQMTVAENLEMGAFWLKDKSHVNEEMEKVYAQFPRLKERYKQAAGTLSGGDSRCWQSDAALCRSENHADG